jgi:hypothetical protein
VVAAGPAGGEIAEFEAVLLTGASSFNSALEDKGPLMLDAGGLCAGRRSVRVCSNDAVLLSCTWLKPDSCEGASGGCRSGARSALGPVGGAIDNPAGTLDFGAAVVAGVVTGANDPGAEGAACTGFGSCNAVVGFASRSGFLQTLEPKAGTAAGGDEARGA